MKILMGITSKYFVSGGAQKNIQALMEGLAQRGHTCRVIAAGVSPSYPDQRETFRAGLSALGIELRNDAMGADVFQYKGVEVRCAWEQVPLREYFLRQIREFDPTWTLIAEDCTNLIEVARDADPDRMIFLIQSTVVLPYGPMSAEPNPIRAKWCRRVAGTITLSRYLQDYVRRWNERESEVIPPPVYGPGPFPNYGNFAQPGFPLIPGLGVPGHPATPLARSAGRGDGRAAQGYVTLINPCLVKGLPIFLDLARAMPDVAFAAVPTWGTTAEDRAALESLPNITLLTAREDVDSIYAQTRVLLAPSLWDEGFGMVVVEAMLRGIPVLASNVGGLPEAKLGVDYLLPVRPIEGYGDTPPGQLLAEPIIPAQDATPWEAALRAVLADQAHYERLSAQSRAAALKFVGTLSIERFEQYFDSLTARSSQAGLRSSKAPETEVAWDQVERMSPARRALLARRLRQVGGEAEVKPVIPRAPRYGDSDSFPLSFAQQRFWFLDQLEPGNAFYNEHFTFRLRGSLNISALQQALTEVVKRHEVLRTSFTLIDPAPSASGAGGRPRQVVLPPFEIPLPLDDLSSLAESARETEALRRAVDESNQPFDLSQPPMIRARLFRLGETEHMLVLVIHHIASDGWSGTLLTRELTVLYEAQTTGKDSPLADLPIQYADYAWWQRETWAKAGNVETLLAYWKQQLEGAPQLLEFPTDHPRPRTQTYRGAVRHFVMSSELAQAVRELSQRESATPFMVLLAAFNALLQRYTGQEDILVGSPIAGRNLKEVEGLIGCFLNTLVFRLHLEGDPTFRELVRRARATALGAYAHQELPFEQLVDELHLTRDMSRNPLFQVMFVFQVAPAFPYFMPGFVMESIALPRETTKFDFTLAITDIGDLMVGDIEYSTDLFDGATMERLVNHWQTLVAGAVADPDQRLSALPLLTESEAKLLTQWNTPPRRDLPLPAYAATPPALKAKTSMPLPEKEAPPNNPGNQAKPSKLQRIAGELHDPESIHQQIQAQSAPRPESSTPFEASRTPLEEKIAAIWAQSLGLERVGVHDDFFELGGHSLLATQILARLSQELGYEVPMDLIFTGAFTVAGLARAIAQHRVEQADQMDLAALLSKLSELSDDEARALLTDKNG